MRIVAINGSHRGGRGYTQFLIDKVFDGARRAGASCETIALAEHTIHRCTGCRICHTEKSYLRCVHHDKDDVAKLFDIMRGADLLIYATPIYIFSMTGLMKLFLDRITSTSDSAIHTVSESGLFFHHIDRRLVSKPFVLITCQDNLETDTFKTVVSYFETFSRFLDAPFVGALRRTSGSLVGQGKDKEKEARHPKIQRIYEAWIQAGEELAATGAIARRTMTVANQRIVEIPKPVEFLLSLRFIRNNRFIMGKIFEQASRHMAEHAAGKAPGQR